MCIRDRILVLSRGGSDQTRLRSLREFVGPIRTALEIAVNKTKELHTSGGEAEKAAPKA